MINDERANPKIENASSFFRFYVIFIYAHTMDTGLVIEEFMLINLNNNIYLQSSRVLSSPVLLDLTIYKLKLGRRKKKRCKEEYRKLTYQ